MKKMMIAFTLAAVCAQATLITDNFNRTTPYAAYGTNTLTTIGNGWTGVAGNLRLWSISSSNLLAGTGAGNFIYKNDATTLNAAAGTSFTQIGKVAVQNNAAAWGGMVVNFDTNTNTGVSFRMSGAGVVQLLRPSGTSILAAEGSITGFVADRFYRMTIFSDTANTYDLEIYDTVANAEVYKKTGIVNDAASVSSDGLGGFYTNTNNPRFDDFSLNVVTPSPASFGLFFIQSAE